MVALPAFMQRDLYQPKVIQNPPVFDAWKQASTDVLDRCEMFGYEFSQTVGVWQMVRRRYDGPNVGGAVGVLAYYVSAELPAAAPDWIVEQVIEHLHSINHLAWMLHWDYEVESPALSLIIGAALEWLRGA